MPPPSPPTCPYCNSPLAELKPSPRPLCPRCGEPLPGGTGAPVDADPAPPIPGRGDVPGATGSSNRAVAAILLGVMGLFAIIGLVFALWTQSFREKNHPPSDDGALASPVNPVALPGLGHLPKDTNLIVALRPADLLDETLGQRLLAPPRPRLIDLALHNVEKWTGQPASNIDHLVVGASLAHADRIPPFTVVVQTRRPYHPAIIAKALGSKAITHQERPLFRFHFEAAGDGYLWCLNNRVMVLVVRLIEAVKLEDLDTIPREPYDGASGLAASVRDAIGRLDKQSLAWAAGDIAEPGLVENVLGVLEKVRTPLPLRAPARSFALGLVPEERALRVSGALRGRDDNANAQLAALLKSATIPGVDIRVTTPTAEAPAADQRWLLFQMRAPVEKVRELLQR